MGIFNNIFSITVLCIVALLLYGAIFSKRVRKLNDDIEGEKQAKIPGYIEKIDTFAKYCPKCQKKLHQKEIHTKKCDTCNSMFKLNPVFLYLSMIGVVIGVVTQFFINIEVFKIVGFVVAIFFILLSATQQKYICKNI